MCSCRAFRSWRTMFGSCWAFSEMRASRHNYGGDRMLEDELLLVVGLQHDRVFVEGPDPSAQLYSTHQINRDWRLVLASSIEKSILNILCRLCFHCADLSLTRTRRERLKQLSLQQSLKIEPGERSWQILRTVGLEVGLYCRSPNSAYLELGQNTLQAGKLRSGKRMIRGNRTEGYRHLLHRYRIDEKN